MWTVEGSVWNKKIKITEKGKKYFKNVDWRDFSISTSVDIDINITGTTDSLVGAGVKEAQFQWKYSDIPSVVKRFVIIGGVGRAYFRRYDDGWRLEDIKIKESHDPEIMSEKEAKEEEFELSQINERKRLITEKKNNEKKRIDNLTRKSKEKNNVLGKITFQWEDYSGVIHKGRLTFNASVTDAGIDTVSVTKNSGGSVTSERSYWFGENKNFKKIYDKKLQCYGIEFSHYHYVTKGRWIPKKWWDSSEEKVDNALKLIKSAKKQWIDEYNEVAQRHNSIDKM